MTIKTNKSLTEADHINISYGEFIIAPKDDYEKIRDQVLNILGALFMEYNSIEVTGLGITKWAGKVLQAKCLTKEPLAIRIFAATPNSLTNPGIKLKERWEYFESTCEVDIEAKILTEESLRLYKEGKDTEAIETAFGGQKWSLF